MTEKEIYMKLRMNFIAKNSLYGLLSKPLPYEEIKQLDDEDRELKEKLKRLSKKEN